MKGNITPKPTRLQHADATQDHNTKLHCRQKKPQMIRHLFGLCLGKLMDFVLCPLILRLFHYAVSTADVTDHTVSRKDKPE